MGAPGRFARQAAQDLREIISHTARNNPSRADTFGDALLFKVQSLGVHPQGGRVVREQADRNGCEIVHGAYRIIYMVTVNPDRVFVLRFWHAARGTPQIVED